MINCQRSTVIATSFSTFLILHSLSLTASAAGDSMDACVRDAEKERVAVVDKVKPSVVAVFGATGQGGGSGVLIRKDGYALTNFLVVQGAGPVMYCGLPDGI